MRLKIFILYKFRYILTFIILFLSNTLAFCLPVSNNPIADNSEEKYFDKFGLQSGIGISFLNLNSLNKEFEVLGIPTISDGFAKITAGLVWGNSRYLNIFRINYLGMNSDASETSISSKFTSMSGVEMILSWNAPIISTYRFGFNGIIGFGSSYYKISYIDQNQTSPYLHSIITSPSVNSQYTFNSSGNLLGETGLELYYKTHWFKKYNFAEINVGISTSYIHSFINKEWKMAGGYPLMDMPEIKLHNYSFLLNISTLWHR